MAKKNNISDKQNNWFGVIYIVFIGVLPLIFTNKLVDGGLLSRQMALAGINTLLAISILIAKFNHKINFGFINSVPYIVIIAFLLIQLLTYFQVNVYSEYWQTISKYSLGIGYLTLTAALLRSGFLKKEQIFIGISILSAIAILIGFSQLANWNSKIDFRDNIYEIKSNFGNKNLFSSVLFFGILSNLALFIDGKYKKAMMILGLLSIIILLIIQTRIVLIALIIFLIIYVFFTSKAINFSSKTIKWGIPSIVLIILIALFSNQSYMENLTDSRSYRERLQVWKNSVEMIKEHPLTGVGAGHWQFQFSKYGIGDFENPAIAKSLTTFQRPHNDFLWIGGESGIPGLVAYLAIFISLLIVILKQIKQKPEDTVLAIVLALIPSYMIIAAADFPLERIEHQILLFSFISIPIAKLSPYRRTKKWAPSIVVMTISLLSLPFIYNRIEGEILTKRLYALQKNTQWPAMLKASEEAQSNAYQIDAKSIPLNYYGGIAAYSSGDIEKAKLKFESALEMSPYNIHTLNNLGSCLNRLGENEKAMELFDLALEISPEFEDAILNKCVIYYNQKKIEDAYYAISSIDIHTTNKSYPQFLEIILTEYLRFRATQQNSPALALKIQDLIENENNMNVEYIAVRNGKGDELTNQIFPLKSRN